MKHEAILVHLILDYNPTLFVIYGNHIINSMNLANALLNRLLLTQRIIVFATIKPAQICRTTTTAGPSYKKINSPTKTRIDIIISVKQKYLVPFFILILHFYNPHLPQICNQKLSKLPDQIIILYF